MEANWPSLWAINFAKANVAIDRMALSVTGFSFFAWSRQIEILGKSFPRPGTLTKIVHDRIARDFESPGWQPRFIPQGREIFVNVNEYLGYFARV
jgi:hypothetical protein